MELLKAYPEEPQVDAHTVARIDDVAVILHPSHVRDAKAVKGVTA